MADAYAEIAHNGQWRKSLPANSIPYITHPRAVMEILYADGVRNEVTLCAALLHDVIEDTKVTYLDLCRLFGDNVADAVNQVTNDPLLPKGNAKHEFQCLRAPSLSIVAAAVKVADKIANITDVIDRPPDWTREKKLEYVNQSRQVVSFINDVSPTLLSRFCNTYKRALAQI